MNSLFEFYTNKVENEFSKIYTNDSFGYTKVTIEQPIIINNDIQLDKKGKYKVDTKKRDFERVPLTSDIEGYFIREVKPYLNNAFMDRTKDKVGYEINFTKYFYQFIELRDSFEILDDLKKIDNEINKLSEEIGL